MRGGGGLADDLPRGRLSQAWLIPVVIVAFVAGGVGGGIAGALVAGGSDSDNGGSNNGREIVAPPNDAVAQAANYAMPGVVTVINEISAGVAGGGGFIVNE